MRIIKITKRNKTEVDLNKTEKELFECCSSHDKIEFICDNCKGIGSRIKSKFIDENDFICKKCKLSKVDRTNYKIKKRTSEFYSEMSNKRTKESFDRAKNTRTKTNIKKYGVENVMLLDTSKEKLKETMLDKYGVSSSLQLEKTKYERRKAHFNDLYNRMILYKIKPLFSFEDWCGRDITIKHKWQCLDCGNIFEFNYYDSKLMPICRKCNKKTSGTSKGEEELQEFTNGIKYRDKLEIDCLIDNIGFEFNGLYWHSDKFKRNDYHLFKTNYFREKGIQIYHIFEDEWRDKKDIVKSIINTKLNKFDKIIYGRKTVIKLVNNKTAGLFQDENHIQGKTSASVKIGLYYEDELVSLMTFSKPRFDKKYQWELIRFVNRKNTKIIGGASKLFKYFIKEYNPNSILSYSDIRLFDGGLYEVLGFKLTHQTPPNFFYFKNGNRYHRMNFQKQNLERIFNKKIDLNKTEKAIMLEEGFNRIYDCGNLVWGWRNNV